MTVEARKIRLIMELRRQGIADTAVLAAVERIPREAFVPSTFRDQAYENRALPIGHGQTVSQPFVVAQMTQALEVDRRMKVLEIGTGSGYQAAVLSRLCRRLYTVERVAPLLREAEHRLTALRLHNVTTRLVDGQVGWPEQAPFLRIIATAAADEPPAGLVDQLAPEGILVLPLGRPGRAQQLVRLRKDAAGRVAEEPLGEVRFVPLRGGIETAEEGAAAPRKTGAATAGAAQVALGPAS